MKPAEQIPISGKTMIGYYAYGIFQRSSQTV